MKSTQYKTNVNTDITKYTNQGMNTLMSVSMKAMFNMFNYYSKESLEQFTIITNTKI